MCQATRSLDPVAVPLLRLAGRDEELHLHLLELERAEDEVAGRDLVPERLADLRDPERRLAARDLEHVLVVDEDALRGLGAEVDLRAGLLDGADARLEHQVELARLGQVAVGRLAGPLARPLPAAHLLVLGIGEVVGAEALLAEAAVDERIGEAADVAGDLPDARVEDDRGVEREDVVALLHHRREPAGLDVVLEQDAVVAVVVGGAEAAVDLRGGEDEPAPASQRDDLLHRDGVVRSHRTGEASAVSEHAGRDGAANVAPMRLYSELADWFHLLTAPEDYAEEAAEIVRLAEAAVDGELRTLLELGSGGGNNASHLKARFDCTLTDVSEEMLALSRGLNPECEHIARRHADTSPRPDVRRRPRPRCGDVHDDRGRPPGCVRDGFRAHAARRRRALPA